MTTWTTISGYAAVWAEEFGNMKVLTGSATWNVGNLVDGAGETSSAITVTGAALGNYVIASANLDTQGMTVTGWVESANTVKIRVQNETGGTINLDSTTWHVAVLQE